MITSFSITGFALLVLKSSLLVALGWCATRLFRRASAATRHLVWLTVIVGVLLMPVVGQLAPVPFRILPATAPVDLTMPVQPSPGGRAAARAAAIASAPVANAVSPRAERASLDDRLDVGRTLAATWAIIATLLVLRLLVGTAYVDRLTRSGRVLVESEWGQLLAEAARRLGMRVTPRLVMSDQVEMAFAYHVTMPTIVVPASAGEWSSDRRRAVLLHELAHIQRRDLVSHAVAGVACALNWFNPLIWAAARQLRIESEMASDEVVIGAGMRPSVYAQHLLDMVTSFGRRTPGVALAMARPGDLEGRLVAILDSDRGARRTRRGGAIVALVALPSLVIGAASPMRRERAAPRPATRVTLTPIVTDSVAVPVFADVAPLRRVMPNIKRPTRADAGVTLSSRQIASLLRFGTNGIVNPMMMLLRDAESLKLSGMQADSIATLNRRYMIRLNHIWSPVSAFYSSRQDASNLPLLTAADDPSRATVQALAEVLPEVAGLLTVEQRGRVTGWVNLYLDARNLPALVNIARDGVFMSPEQLSGIRGRGRGGG